MPRLAMFIKCISCDFAPTTIGTIAFGYILVFILGLEPNNIQRNCLNIHHTLECIYMAKINIVLVVNKLVKFLKILKLLKSCRLRFKKFSAKTLRFKKFSAKTLQTNHYFLWVNIMHFSTMLFLAKFKLNYPQKPLASIRLPRPSGKLE